VTTRRNLAASLAAVAAVAALILVTGCQTGPRRIAVPFADLSYAAADDSLGIAAFEFRPPAEQRRRAADARRWLARANAAADLAGEMRALRTAVGLDPSLGVAWLRLARLCRWYGDYQQTEDALGGFAAAMPALTARRHELAGWAAVCASWLRYDRGEWKRGLVWADSAAAHGAPEDEVQLLRALHLAGLGRNKRAEDIAYRFAQADHRSHWIYGVSYWRRTGPEPAHGVFSGRGVVNVSPEVLTGAMVPRDPRAAECYRDYGRVEELMGNWWLAGWQYEASADFVPGMKRANVLRIDHTPLGAGLEGATQTLPVWLAFDRWYVTGSLSAYTSLASARHAAAVDPGEREFWAAAVVDAAGICVRLQIDEAYARRARGLVLADYRDQWPQAVHDLQAAQRVFDRRRLEDVETLAALGNLHLHRERPAQARPLLERAVALAPDRARAWSDLGLALVQLGEADDAMRALERALGLDDTLAVAWYNRGLLRFHLGDLDGAVDDLQRAEELAPADPSIGRLLEELERRRRSGTGS
jgi:tetratricopeptide (TPR) repeat protein